MEKIKYVVYKEKRGDETHEHELEEVFASESLRKAQDEMAKIEDVYARIDEVRETYNPPPSGKVWKREDDAWDKEYISTIEEN